MPAPIKVELFPHSAAWAEAAVAESRRLAESLRDLFIVMHHIGSTAIAGIDAKPIIDLLPVVRSLIDLDARQSALESLGNRYWGEYGITGRRDCTRDDPAGRRLFQLHCFAPDSPEIERHLAFRNYLRAHPQKAQEYHVEKHRCRDLHPNDSHAYSDAKAAWIEAELPRALEWHRRTNFEA